MFRIRKIADAHLPANDSALQQVFEIIREQFPDIAEEKIQKIKTQLLDPLHYRFSTSLIIAEDGRLTVKGFALVLYMPDMDFCYLDYIAVKPGRTSSGVGGALYERIREEARFLTTTGIFMECLPDDPLLCKNKDILSQNKARLAFYERYGARPVVGTAYETPVKPGDDCPPYLVYDPLGKNPELSAPAARKIIRAILNRKYPEYCPGSYIKMVLDSIKEDPVRLRNYLYRKPADEKDKQVRGRDNIALVVNDKHDIHHVREIGYVESPVRIKSILQELEKTDFFVLLKAKNFPEHHITAVHSTRYVNYFKKVCENLPEGKSVYPYVFPLRNAARPPADLSVLAGYYCIDTFTPLNKNAYMAARGAVNCSLTCAEMLLTKYSVAYALIRPPGHHAEKSVFGGFCYFNNAAIAADYLSKYGKVAILDIDYHHGNGQQQIFYNRKDVLTVSIHGNPSFAYPYFSGFSDEKGEDEGYGYNYNIPLPESVSGEKYHRHLRNALKIISGFSPLYMIICLGFDTAKGDPTGTWSMCAADFRINGEILAEMNIPTLFIQEGGYKNRSLGPNARSFFEGYMKHRYINKKSVSRR